MSDEQPKIHQEFNGPVYGVTGETQGQYINSSPPQAPPTTPRDPNSLEGKLVKSIARKNRERLNQAFHQQVRANPQLRDESERLGGGPRTPLLQQPREVENSKTHQWEEITSSKPIEEVFSEAQRQLLILGEPGSGKTTELLCLVDALVKDAQHDANTPIPVIFELSTWQPNLTIVEWLVERLNSDFGLKTTVCWEWLRKGTNKILPLLDGLDELGELLSDDAMEAINELQNNDRQYQQPALVVCCRIQDYDLCKEKLEVEGAIRLLKLPDEEIERYLNERKALHLMSWLHSDPMGFGILMRTPMILNILPQTYPYRDYGQPGQLPTINAVVDLETYRSKCQAQIFDDFLDKTLPKVEKKYPKARQYLVFIATQMEQRGQREFLIERLQPSWLLTEQERKQYRWSYGRIFGRIMWLITWLVTGFTVGLVIRVVIELSYGLGGKCAAILIDEIVIAEAIDFSRSRIQTHIGKVLIAGLSAGLFGVFLYWLRGWQIYGFIGGLVVGLIGGLILVLKTDIKVRDVPNQGIRAMLKRSSSITLWTALIIPMIFIPITLVIGQSSEIGVAMIRSMIGIGIFLGFLASGGFDLIAYLALRITLYSNDYSPWNYADFLNLASDESTTNILKRTGGSYRFYHDKLREHLAKSHVE